MEPVDSGGLLSDDFIGLNLHTDLVGPELPQLETVGPPREVVFGLGEHEVRAILGEDSEHWLFGASGLSALPSEDLTTLRLFQNGDDANVLWEKELVPQIDLGYGDEPVISADNGFIHIAALVDAAGQPVGDDSEVKWEIVSGSASGGVLSDATTKTTNGGTAVTLFTGRHAGQGPRPSTSARIAISRLRQRLIRRPRPFPPRAAAAPGSSTAGWEPRTRRCHRQR